MKMLHYFNYDGQDSRDYGLYIVSQNAFDKPQRDVSFISVPGHDGDIVIDNGGYKNLKLTLKLRLFAEKVENNINDLAFSYNRALNWLQQTATYHKLIFSYDENYYREACVFSGIKATKRYDDVIDFTVTFSCKPFRKSFEGDKKIIITAAAGATFFNPEMFSSKPYMKIIPADGTQNFTIAIYKSLYNYDYYTFYQADEYVEIDSESMNVFKGNINKNNDYAATSFPEFKPGTISISFIGNIASIEIIPRWRTL